MNRGWNIGMTQDPDTSHVPASDGNSTLRTIDYVTNVDRPKKIINEIVETLSSTREFYHYGDSLVRIYKSGEIKYVNRNNISGCLHDLLEIKYLKKRVSDDGTSLRLQRSDFLPHKMESFFYQSDGTLGVRSVPSDW